MVDTQRSERCERKLVEVQILSSAPWAGGGMVYTYAWGAYGRKAVQVQLLSRPQMES